jgi:signal transduction histidine kinase
MSSRSSHVRLKVVALLGSMTALWAFAAFVTVREGLNLLSVSTLDSGVGRPTVALLSELQEERRLSMVNLGRDGQDVPGALAAQRSKTDAALVTFQTLTSSGDVAFARSPALAQRINDTLAQLQTLPTLRDGVTQRSLDRARTAEMYTNIVDAGFRIFDSLATLDDKEIAKDIRTLIVLSRAREVLSQEDALLAGALAAGELTTAEHSAFLRLVGTQRFLYDEGVGGLPPEDFARFDAFRKGSVFLRFLSLENQIVEGGQASSALVRRGDWNDATTAVFTELRRLEQVSADDIVARAAPAGAWVVVRLGLAGGLGLLAVIASIVISITTARQLIRQLERLRTAARELAAYRLPRVVERLQHGERVDVDVEAPPLDFGNDEIGQVGQAFNAVQETAVRVAVEQAELRRSVRDVFLSLARRSQALLHRQLGLLDAMERRATDSEELAELFRIDHLATRMRRNAENLIVLSGATAGRAWRKPVPMVDVLRGALAEVEDYTRVTVMPVGNASLVGRAVGDVIHLLAELIENAVSFSPPQTVVRVGGSVVGNGYAIEIEDRGLGMSEDERRTANAQLNEPPEFKLSSTARLGLYVVGKLAERHGIRVKLTESPYGGTTAIVLLPSTLMAEELGDDVFSGPLDVSELDTGRSVPLAIAAGRHRIAGETTITPAPTLPRRVPTDPEEADGEPAPSEGITPVELSGPRPTIMTPSGLPWRQREGAASEPPPGSRYENGVNGTVVEPTPAQIGRAGRGPEEMRNIMSSYRSGTLRGRSEAARLASDDEAPERTAPATPESPGTDERG